MMTILNANASNTAPTNPTNAVPVYSVDIYVVTSPVHEFVVIAVTSFCHGLNLLESTLMPCVVQEPMFPVISGVEMMLFVFISFKVFF